MYSRITEIRTVGFYDGHFDVSVNEIRNLTDERDTLLRLSDSFGKYTAIAYPDEKSLDYLHSCFEQYCLPDPFSFLAATAPESSEIISAFGYIVFDELAKNLSVTGEMKYFFDDYKNYYYLPAEGYAVHKSVAQFTDKSARIPASRENAYTKKAGIFIPASPYSEKKLFRASYDDSQNYVMFDDPDPMTCLHLISHKPQDV